MTTMNTPRERSPKTPARILFVDDEDKARKYFRKACENDFEVLDASNVADAVALLDEHSDSIGVLVTDQRMPGKTGTDLLALTRQRYPEIVRILTTAYSDLDSAIEAVNTGAIFQYVSKPWNVRELRGILLRAMEHYQLQRERDALLCEKLSVLQRMLMLDRARVLCVLGAALDGRLRYPLHGVRDYLGLIMGLVDSAPPPPAAGWEDMWLSNVDESQCAIDMTQRLLGLAVPAGFSEVSASALAPADAGHVRFASSLDGPDRLVADPALLKALADSLARLAQALWAGREAALTLAAGDDDTITATLAPADGGPIADDAMPRLLQVALHTHPEPEGPWLDLLTCHLLTAHHGGAVQPAFAPGDNPSTLVLHLPRDAGAATKPDLGPDWLETLFLAFEG